MRSKFERRVAQSLKDRGVQYTYEEYSYEYAVKVVRSECQDCGSTNVVTGSRWYTPDFFLSNGIIIETKGEFTAKDRVKMVAVKEQHPELDLRLVFMRDNKLSRQSRTRYSEWAKKNGFKYAISDVPDAWLKETK